MISQFIKTLHKCSDIYGKVESSKKFILHEKCTVENNNNTKHNFDIVTKRGHTLNKVNFQQTSTIKFNNDIFFGCFTALQLLKD